MQTLINPLLQLAIAEFWIKAPIWESSTHQPICTLDDAPSVSIQNSTIAPIEPTPNASAASRAAVHIYDHVAGQAPLGNTLAGISYPLSSGTTGISIPPYFTFNLQFPPSLVLGAFFAGTAFGGWTTLGSEDT